ncbi:sensor histidine kinase [Roseobacter weihaiensis]|uniref:sensor histidine kinase n=1 Tax=Roseobacter weihaiensis TaxID=2763262 RepID=UPI001D0A2071|nr:HAMP domain-containing sensor histidine kinase [Roseobacter sp. H9]
MNTPPELHQQAPVTSGLDPVSSSTEFEDFIYLVSHDVRNSVRALIELPQWISDDLAEAGIKVEGSVAESIALMNSHTGRLDRMLVDLLAFSRVGRMQDVSEIAVDVALTEVLEEMRIPPGFQVRAELDTNDLYIGERDGLTLLTQLISNAIKHHDKTAGSILISFCEEAGQTVLRVEDDGPGIAPEYREKIFGAMTTLRPRDEVEGSGMGLAIVRKIAQVYGGRATVSDAKGARGTLIEVSLPKQPAALPCSPAQS